MIPARSRRLAVVIAVMILLLALLACRGRRRTRGEELVVFAAASLTDALREIGTRYGETGTHIVFNFAGTNTLRDQIEHGAEADLFLSANPEHMDTLEAKGLLLPGSRVDLLANRLVLIARSKDVRDATFPDALADPNTIRRVAIAEPDVVPAGIYGKAALTQLGLWKVVLPRLVPALDVRAVLAYVASGNAGVGIVYATDAAIVQDVRVVYEFPATSHPPIRYPAAILRSTHDEASARRFLDYLRSEEGRAVFERYGFLTDVGRRRTESGR